jgi:tetratricopeptide (TPR) repeat protein
MRKLLLAVLVITCQLLLAAPSIQKEKAAVSEEIQQFNKGVEAQKKHDYVQAILCYQKAVQIKADFPDAWNNLGYCFRRIAKMQLDKSAEAYSKALRYAPKHPQALEYQAELFLMQGELEYAYHNYEVLQALKSEEAGEIKEKIDPILKQAQNILKKYNP